MSGRPKRFHARLRDKLEKEKSYETYGSGNTDFRMNRSANDNVRHWHASYNTSSAAQPNIGHLLSQYGSSQRALASEYGSEFLAKSDKVEDVTNQVAA